LPIGRSDADLSGSGRRYPPRPVPSGAVRGCPAPCDPAFPDYRDNVDAVSAGGDVVTATGRSECGEPALAGPARWTAVVRMDKVARWQVEAVPGA
jgi:hypothetical protein